MHRPNVCMALADAVWMCVGRSDKRISVRLCRPLCCVKPSLISAQSENTLFEKKQETIFEKDVITSQFTLPAFCYCVCVCVCMCVCVCVCVCVWSEGTQENSKQIYSTVSQQTLSMVSHSAQKHSSVSVCMWCFSLFCWCQCLYWQYADFSVCV